MQTSRYVFPMIALASAFFLQGTFAKQPPIMAAPPIVALMPFLTDNPDFFDLTDTQKKAISKIASQSNFSREGLDQLILDLRAELQTLLFTYGSNPKEVESLRKDLLKQEAARLQLSVDCAMGLQKVLTAEQWNTLMGLAKQ